MGHHYQYLTTQCSGDFGEEWEERMKEPVMGLEPWNADMPLANINSEQLCLIEAN